MIPETQQLLHESWRRIEPQSQEAARLFYDRLFELDPSVRPLFAATDLREQGRKVMQMLAEMVRMMDDPERYVPDLAALGRRHVGYGARDGHYDAVGAALLWSLEQQLGDRYTPDVRDAWSEAYRLMAAVMRRAAARAPGQLTGEFPVVPPRDERTPVP